MADLQPVLAYSLTKGGSLSKIKPKSIKFD